jgi:holin-like protein
LALLLGALVARGRLPDDLERAANGILSYLPMLFVPAAIGVVAPIRLIRATDQPLPGPSRSSVKAIAATAAAMRAIERLQALVAT